MKHQRRQLKRVALRIATVMLMAAALFVTSFYFAGERVLAQGGPRYEITVTNLTRGQQFTPILVATHRAGIRLFTLGSPATPELATVAEEGDTAPLTKLLLSTPGVSDVTTSSGLLNPGASVTISVPAVNRFDHFSIAAMLIPTNDAFFAINGVEGPRSGTRGDDTLTLSRLPMTRAAKGMTSSVTRYLGQTLQSVAGRAEAARLQGTKRDTFIFMRGFTKLET